MKQLTKDMIFIVIVVICLILVLAVIVQSQQAPIQQDDPVQEVLERQALLTARLQADKLAVGMNQILNILVQDPKYHNIVRQGSLLLAQNGYFTLQVPVPEVLPDTTIQENK